MSGDREALRAALEALPHWDAGAPGTQRVGVEVVNRDAMLVALAATEAAGIEGPHPDEPHEFRTICSRCGERGWLNVALITDSERVVIESRDARSTPE